METSAIRGARVVRTPIKEVMAPTRRFAPSHRWALRWTEAMHHSSRCVFFLFVFLLSSPPTFSLSVCLCFCSPLIYCWSGWRNDPGAFHSERREERQHSDNGNTFCQRGARKKKKMGRLASLMDPSRYVNAGSVAFRRHSNSLSRSFAPSFRAEMTPAATPINTMSFTADKHSMNGCWSLFPVFY